MKFSPTITQESAVMPGVSFKVHRIGISRRADIDRKTLALRQRLRELELDYPAQSKEEELLAEQLDIAKRKAILVPEGERESVIKNDMFPIVRKISEATPIDIQKRRRVLDEEYATIHGDIRCIWIKEGLIAITGGAEFEFDGMTPDQFLEYGPIELAREIYEFLDSGGRLAGTASKNSSSLGTSGNQEQPAMKDTSAASAVSAAGTYNATAFDITSPVLTPV